jgi:YidC/Oxa1 family membrane protein insertase
MEKRLLLSMVLCLLILLVYQAYVEKQNERWKAARPEAVGEGLQETPAEPDRLDPKGDVASQGLAEGLQGEEEELGDVPRDVRCEEVVVDTPLYQAVFCSRNGRPMRWTLKNYQQNKACECPVQIPGLRKEGLPADLYGGSPAWVERIHAQGPEEYPLALEISTGRDKRIPIREALEPDRFRLDLSDGEQPARITFSGTDSRGREVERVYTFAPDTYMVGLEIEIAGLEPVLQQAGLAMSLTERIPEGASDRYTFSGFMAFINEGLEKEKELDAGEPQYYNGNVHWQGFSDKYFLTTLLPVDNPVSSVNLEQLHSADGQSPGLFISRLIYNIQPHLQGDTARFAYSIYVGPKDLDVLRDTGHFLEKSIDLGWFGFIAKPLLVVLKFFYRYTHNYGIAIIILTVLIKILFYPLTRKQMESMGQMQKLQPKMKAIREKFKDDKERLNKEVMDLYRTHKINPLGGCWPMLLQIPVFFALYKALLNSIELRHAPFMFWIQDLSEKDPCYITPIIMGATMFLQQKMTPAAGDPNQQKMMMFMPLIFTFMFLNFPSGLVLYWLVNNVLTIGQQFVSQRRQQ